MLSSLISFLAPAAAPAPAIDTSPSAVARRVAARPRGRAESTRLRLAFAGRIIGDAIGFAVLFSGSWLALQVLAALL